MATSGQQAGSTGVGWWALRALFVLFVCSGGLGLCALVAAALVPVLLAWAEPTNRGEALRAWVLRSGGIKHMPLDEGRQLLRRVEIEGALPSGVTNTASPFSRAALEEIARVWSDPRKYYEPSLQRAKAVRASGEPAKRIAKLGLACAGATILGIVVLVVLDVLGLVNVRGPQSRTG